MKGEQYERVYANIIADELKAAEDAVKRLSEHGPSYHDLVNRTAAYNERVDETVAARNRVMALRNALRCMDAMTAIRGAVLFTG